MLYAFFRSLDKLNDAGMETERNIMAVWFIFAAGRQFVAERMYQ